MSALVGVSVAPISTSGLTSLPIIPTHQQQQQQHFRQRNMSEFPLPEFAHFPSGERRAERTRRHSRTQSRRVSALRGHSRDKSRRSVNAPAYHRPKDARMVSVRVGRCIEVRRDGQVRTGTINSQFGVFEFVFYCHVFPFLKSCSVGAENPLLSNATRSAGLFRFKASGRYLCVDKVGEVYSLPVPGNTSNHTKLEECIFQSVILSDQYDVYYSRQYPTHSDRCRAGPTSGSGPPKRGKRACKTRWYLGVDRTGRVRTIKTAVDKIRQSTLFIKHWLYQMKDNGLPNYHHHPTTASPTSFDSNHVTSVEGVTRNEGLFEMGKNRGKSKSKSVFTVLSGGHKNRNSRRHRGGEKDGGPEAEIGNRKSRCDNLLKTCRPEVISRGADSRGSTARRKTRTEITDQS